MTRAHHVAIVTGRGIGTGAPVGNSSSGDAVCHHVPSEDDEANTPLEQGSSRQRTEEGDAGLSVAWQSHAGDRP